MPASPRATAAIDAIASCVPDASTIGAATGLSQVVIGSQNGLNWMKPPTEREDGEHGHGQTIERGPSRPPWLRAGAPRRTPSARRRRR